MTLTETQQRALIAFCNAGGEGVIDKNGRLVARGERLRFETITWLRLVTLGMIESLGPARLSVTPAGRLGRLGFTPPVKVHSNSTGRQVEAIPGAE